MQHIQALTFDTNLDQWAGSRGFTLRQAPMPTLDEARQPEDATSVIIKVLFAGVCGTDRGIWNRTVFRDLLHESLQRQHQTRRILGHEFVGEIVAAGSQVETLYADADPLNKAKVRVGGLVSGDSHVTCGKCYQCRLGEANVCMNEAIMGVSIDGVFAEYVKLPAKNLWAVDPARVRPEIAAMYDPFGNAVHATTRVDVRGQRVAVLGAGPIGMFSILLLRQFGAAKIIAADVNPANLALAKSLGAHETIRIPNDPKAQAYLPDEAVVSRIMELTYGKGVDVAIEMAGPPSSINNAFEVTRRGGQVVLFGLKDGDITIPEFSRFIVKGLTIQNIIGRRIFHTWQIAQRVLSDQTNGIQDAIWRDILRSGQGTILPFSEYTPAAFEQAMNTHPKIVLSVNQ